MMCFTLISLVLNFIGQKKLEKSIVSPWVFTLAGMYAFLIGILYFARELGFGMSWEVGFLYVVFVGTIIAKFDIERTKEAITYKRQSYTTYRC